MWYGGNKLRDFTHEGHSISRKVGSEAALLRDTGVRMKLGESEKSLGSCSREWDRELARGKYEWCVYVCVSGMTRMKLESLSW